MADARKANKCKRAVREYMQTTMSPSSVCQAIDKQYQRIEWKIKAKHKQRLPSKYRTQQSVWHNTTSVLHYSELVFPFRGANS